MKVLITGASGFIGKDFKDCMVSLGHDVVVLSKSAASVEKLKSDGVIADTFDNIDRHLRGVDSVIHLGTRNNNVHGTEQEFIDDNCKLSSWLGSRARDAGVKRFIFVTSIKALSPAPDDFYGASKAMAERVLETLENENFNVIKVRLPAVWGAGSKGKIRDLAALPGFLRPLVFSVLRALVPLVSIDRVVSCLVALSDSSVPANSEVCLSDPLDGNLYYKTFVWLMNSCFVLFVFVVLLVPVFIAGVFISLTSRGGAIHRQTRLGRDRLPFRFIKLRTMQKGAPLLGTHECKSAHVTGVGGTLRKYKLDEIPQVLNVICREMNVVGPRPCLVSQIDVIAARRKFGVFDIRPGVTGLSQVSGLDMSQPARLALADYRYMLFRSVTWDLKILLKTITGAGFRDPLAESVSRSQSK